MRLSRDVIGRIAVIAVATIVVVGAMVWLSGVLRTGRIEAAAPRETPTGPLPPTVAALRVEMAHDADVVGTIQAETRTAIAARVVANIGKIHKASGDAVERGATLIELADSDLRSRQRQAEAALLSAQASRKLAEVQRTSKADQFARAAATKLELDEAEARYQVADAEVARAQQVLEEAKIAVGFATITAPYSGVIIDRLAVEGEQASPGKTLLTMYDPTRLRLEASVREAYIGYLEKGQKIAVHIDAVRDPATRAREGTVEQIVPAADPASRSFLVKVSLDQKNAQGLFPGMFGRMTVKLDARQRLLIPADAVEYVGQLALVRVVEGGRVHTRSVRVGQEVPQRKMIEVLSGLREGELVAVPASR